MSGFVTPWSVARQAPLSMGFPRQEYWSGLPFPSPTNESEKWKWSHIASQQGMLSSVAQPCPTLCDPMDSSTPGFPVHHQLPEPKSDSDLKHTGNTLSFASAQLIMISLPACTIIWLLVCVWRREKDLFSSLQTLWIPVWLFCCCHCNV